MSIQLFAKNLKYLREKKRWTCAMLAGKLKVHPSNIPYWENEKGWPRTHAMILSICDLFKVTADQLIREDLQEKKTRTKKVRKGVVYGY